MVDLPLRTARLNLRAFTLEDAPAAHAVYSDADVMSHVGDGPVTDIASTEAMLRDYIAHQASHGFSFWAVIERASGAVIGDARLYLLGGHGPEVEVGYTLGRDWWGRGYATEAARSPGERPIVPLCREFVRGERRDSNPRPPGPQPGALPAELRPPSAKPSLAVVRAVRRWVRAGSAWTRRRVAGIVVRCGPLILDRSLWRSWPASWSSGPWRRSRSSR